MSTVPSNTPDQIAAPPEGAVRRTPWWWWAALGALMFLNLCVYAQWSNPQPPAGTDDLDASWFAVLHWAHVHQVDFGHDLIFMYGPTYFATSWLLPATFKGVALSWLLLSTAYFVGLVRVSRFTINTRWVAGSWLLAVILLTGLPINILDTRLFLLSWLLLLIYFYVDDRVWSASHILLTIGMALVALMKFSFFLAALPVVAVIGADQLWRRRVPWTPIIYAAALAGVWLAAGQKLQNFAPYVKNVWGLSDGYVESEMLFPPDALLDVGEFVLTAVLILVALSLVHPWKWISKPAAPVGPPALSFRQSLLGTLGTAGLLFVIFKSDYVRQDSHEIAATTALAIMAVTLGTAVWPRIQDGVAQTFVVLLGLGAIYLSWGSIEKFNSINGPSVLLDEIAEVPARAAANVEAILGQPGPMKGTGEDAPNVVRPLPQVEGSVDIYSWGQRELLSQGMDYQPRPVFQSYATFTSALLDMNARFLAGPRAARTILFDIQTFDYRYPAQDDSLSWPELLTRYDLKDATGSHLVLQRAEEPREYELAPLGAVDGSLGLWSAVPESDDPIWVKLDVRLTPLGRIARFLYKPPFLELEVRTRSQKVLDFRLQRESAAAGFLLSPQISDRMAFGMLYSPQWKEELADDQITDISVRGISSSDGTSPCYQAQYAIQYFGLRYPHVDISKVPGVPDYQNLRQIFQQMTIFQAPVGAAPQFVENDDGRMVIQAHAPTRILIPVPVNAREFHFGFGMPNSTFDAGDPADGMVFRAYIVDAVHGNEISAAGVWGRQLDPTNLRVDRGLQEATIRLPENQIVYGVLLEAVPEPQHQHNDLYWTDMKFR